MHRGSKLYESQLPHSLERSVELEFSEKLIAMNWHGGKATSFSDSEICGCVSSVLRSGGITYW